MLHHHTASEVLNVVYRVSECLRGIVVARISLAPPKPLSNSANPSHVLFIFSLLRLLATEHQMDLKLLTKKRKLYYNGSWWTSSRRKGNLKNK